MLLFSLDAQQMLQRIDVKAFDLAFFITLLNLSGDVDYDSSVEYEIPGTVFISAFDCSYLVSTAIESEFVMEHHLNGKLSFEMHWFLSQFQHG